VTSVVVIALAIGLPALAFTLWPIIGRRDGRPPFLAAAPDARQALRERKRQVLGALRELEFEHEAGHLAADDYADLRARYEAEAAEVLRELDALGPEPAPPPRAVPVPAGSARGWRHPLALGTAAVALVAFGIAIGSGIARYSTREPPPATAAPGPAGSGPVVAAGRGPLAPEMLQGMLGAARASLAEGRYGEAIAAYRAVLARDPKNVDALTHLGLIVAIGGHADQALETFDRALALDPNYAPAHLYRGQVLYESKGDVAGAIAAWQRYVALVPPGEDRERVERLIAEARARRGAAD
jgi:tetratricopeptide (TPR) repeat protein